MRCLNDGIALRTAVCAGVLGVLMLPSPATPAAHATDASEEIIEQILDLRQRLEALLEALPPELREEVERRWQQRQTAAEPPTDTPATEPQPPAETQSLTEARSPTETQSPAAAESLAPAAAPEACASLRALDTNQDGTVSAADRYWRFLRLWFDQGDGEIEEGEIEGLYALGVREIDSRLRYFRDAEGDTGDLATAELVRLQLFAAGRAAGRTGALVIEAGRLSGTGELRLLDAAGATLSGYQPLAPGIVFEAADGSRWPLTCP